MHHGQPCSYRIHPFLSAVTICRAGKHRSDTVTVGVSVTARVHFWVRVWVWVSLSVVVGVDLDLMARVIVGVGEGEGKGVVSGAETTNSVLGFRVRVWGYD